MYLIFDTETTGLTKNWRAPISDTENWPRCVQLAWQVHDEIGNLIESKSYIVKPDNFDIPYESEKIHGISTLLAEREGIELDNIFNEFNDSITYLGTDKEVKRYEVIFSVPEIYWRNKNLYWLDGDKPLKTIQKISPNQSLLELTFFIK